MYQDDYIVGALMLYVIINFSKQNNNFNFYLFNFLKKIDIIQLFLYILEILNRLRGEEWSFIYIYGIFDLI